jgi:5-methylcytosine-specific restriction protein A
MLKVYGKPDILRQSKYIKREPLEKSGGFSKRRRTAMPRKPKRPCGHTGCPNLSDSYYCEQHRKERAKIYDRFGRDPVATKRYNGAWRKIRASVIQANPLCAECQRHGRIVPATDVHHIKPLTEGGTHAWDNLMSLCHSCHSAVTMTANNAKRA